MKKKAEYPVFSNGTEFSLWEARNCDECIKSSRYKPETDTYTKYHCAVQREIHEAYMDDGRTSQRVYDICQQPLCPYKKTERNITHVGNEFLPAQIYSSNNPKK